MSIEQDLQEVINKNLPQAAGELLQQRLAQADRDAARVKDLETTRDKNAERIGQLDKQVSELRAKLAEHEAIDVREAAVAARENAAEIEALKVQLAAAHTNTAFAKDIALGLVRNVEYRSSVFSNGYQNEPIMKDGYQVGTQRVETNNNVTETKSVG